MDGSKIVTLAHEAENEIKGWLKSQRSVLILRCKEGSADVYVATGMQASVEYGAYDSHTVRLRFDDSSPQTQRWRESTDHEALFAPKPKEFARRLAASKTFRFEFTPFQANPTISEFRVAGLEQHLPKLADACRWNIRVQQ